MRGRRERWDFYAAFKLRDLVYFHYGETHQGLLVTSSCKLKFISHFRYKSLQVTIDHIIMKSKTADHFC
jgi:hypothetical protein